MRTIKFDTLMKQARAGRAELMSDISRAGYVELRKPNGKRETMQVVDMPGNNSVGSSNKWIHKLLGETA